jgi:hypothetical protein
MPGIPVLRSCLYGQYCEDGKCMGDPDYTACEDTESAGVANPYFAGIVTMTDSDGAQTYQTDECENEKILLDYQCDGENMYLKEDPVKIDCSSMDMVCDAGRCVGKGCETKSTDISILYQSAESAEKITLETNSDVFPPMKKMQPPWIGDFNGDGDPDLVWGYLNFQHIWSGSGATPNFHAPLFGEATPKPFIAPWIYDQDAPSPYYSQPLDWGNIADAYIQDDMIIRGVGQFAGNGYTDLIIGRDTIYESNNDIPQMSVWTGSFETVGSFSKFDYYNSIQTPFFHQMDDLNQDGYQDLIYYKRPWYKATVIKIYFGSKNASAPWSAEPQVIYLNGQPCDQEPVVPIPGGLSSVSYPYLITGNFTSKKYKDLIVGCEYVPQKQYRLLLVKNSGEGEFEAPTISLLSVLPNLYANPVPNFVDFYGVGIRGGDLNNDGLDDLIFYSFFKEVGFNMGPRMYLWLSDETDEQNIETVTPIERVLQSDLPNPPDQWNDLTPSTSKLIGAGKWPTMGSILQPHSNFPHIADFNNDGLKDIAIPLWNVPSHDDVISPSNNKSTIGVGFLMAEDDTGTFPDPTLQILRITKENETGTSYFWMNWTSFNVKDVNGDGCLDILVGSQEDIGYGSDGSFVQHMTTFRSK